MMEHSPRRNGWGVIVGRFQADDLTAGHRALIEYVARVHDENVLVVLGAPRTPENATDPLNLQIRKAMVLDSYGYCSVVALPDTRSNRRWSQNLDALIESVAGNNPVHLYSGRDGFLPWYSGKYDCDQLNFDIEISATEVRRAIKETPLVHNKDFRAGVIYAHQNRIMQTYESVDIALIKFETDGRIMILLGHKIDETPEDMADIGCGVWRFPGGFADKKGETLKQAASRELYEETRMYTMGGLTLVDEFLLTNEWRIQRKEGVQHRTFLYYGEATWETPKGADDLPVVKWFDVDEVEQNASLILIGEHKERMFARLMEFLRERQIVKSLPLLKE